MKPADVADLYAFMKTLPAVAGKAPGHTLGFPFNIRRGLGLWKLLYLSDAAGDRACRRRAGTGRCSAAIWSKARAIAANAIRRAPSPADRRRTSGWRAPSPPKATASCPTSRRARAASATGRRATSPAISKPASRRISIRSAARWSRSRRTWRSCTPDDRAAIAAYLKAVPPHPTAIRRAAAAGELKQRLAVAEELEAVFEEDDCSRRSVLRRRAMSRSADGLVLGREVASSDRRHGSCSAHRRPRRRCSAGRCGADRRSGRDSL